jgi:hypothetical protein
MLHTPWLPASAQTSAQATDLANHCRSGANNDINDFGSAAGKQQPQALARQLTVGWDG